MSPAITYWLLTPGGRFVARPVESAALVAMAVVSFRVARVAQRGGDLVGGAKERWRAADRARRREAEARARDAERRAHAVAVVANRHRDGRSARHALGDAEGDALAADVEQ